jgi:hypothetical protein
MPIEQKFWNEIMTQKEKRKSNTKLETVQKKIYLQNRKKKLEQFRSVAMFTDAPHGMVAHNKFPCSC